jgi:CBS-domain-containing membrane protein
VMSEGVYYCHEADPVERAAEIMAQHQVRRLPVLNRDKRLVGIITLGDIGRHAERMPEAAERVLEGVAEPGHEPRR